MPLVQVSSIKQAYDQAESELNLSRSKLKECDTQISCIAKEQQNLQQKLSDAAVERKKMENEVLLMDLSCILSYIKVWKHICAHI